MEDSKGEKILNTSSETSQYADRDTENNDSTKGIEATDTASRVSDRTVVYLKSPRLHLITAAFEPIIFSKFLLADTAILESACPSFSQISRYPS